VKTLVYTLATGDSRFYRQAIRCIDSLRHVGYKGDIGVIADRPDFLTARTYLGALKCATSARAAGHWQAVQAKTRAYTQFNPLQYDAILFLDSDILAIRSIDPLFDRVLRGKMHHFAFGKGNMLGPSGAKDRLGGAAERRIAAVLHAANVGTFCFIPSTVEKDVFIPWRAEMKKIDGDLRCPEQQCLNICRLRGQVRAALFPPGTVCFPACTPPPNPSGKHVLERYVDPVCCLLHYCGPSGRGPQLMERDYKEITGHR